MSPVWLTQNGYEKRLFPLKSQATLIAIIKHIKNQTALDYEEFEEKQSLSHAAANLKYLYPAIITCTVLCFKQFTQMPMFSHFNLTDDVTFDLFYACFYKDIGQRLINYGAPFVDETVKEKIMRVLGNGKVCDLVDIIFLCSNNFRDLLNELHIELQQNVLQPLTKPLFRACSEVFYLQDAISKERCKGAVDAWSLELIKKTSTFFDSTKRLIDEREFFILKERTEKFNKIVDWMTRNQYALLQAINIQGYIKLYDNKSDPMVYSIPTFCARYLCTNIFNYCPSFKCLMLPDASQVSLYLGSKLFELQLSSEKLESEEIFDTIDIETVLLNPLTVLLYSDIFLKAIEIGFLLEKNVKEDFIENKKIIPSSEYIFNYFIEKLIVLYYSLSSSQEIEGKIKELESLSGQGSINDNSLLIYEHVFRKGYPRFLSLRQAAINKQEQSVIKAYTKWAQDNNLISENFKADSVDQLKVEIKSGMEQLMSTLIIGPCTLEWLTAFYNEQLKEKYQKKIADELKKKEEIIESSHNNHIVCAFQQNELCARLICLLIIDNLNHVNEVCVPVLPTEPIQSKSLSARMCHILAWLKSYLPF